MKYIVFLTDGEEFESGDGQLMKLAKTYCIIGTTRYRLHVNDPRNRADSTPVQVLADNQVETSARFEPSPMEQNVTMAVGRPIFPSVQVIPFGHRNQPTPLPPDEQTVSADKFNFSNGR